MLIPIVPLFLYLYSFRNRYSKVLRNLKLLETDCKYFFSFSFLLQFLIWKSAFIVKGPILSHVDSTLNGLTTIRTCFKTNDYKNIYYAKYNNHTAAYFPFVAIKRWFAIRIDLIVVGFVCLVLVSCIALNGKINS